MAKHQETQLHEIKEWLGTGSINVFGVPFAGKDTQGKRLADTLGGTLLGGGDILRGADIPDRVRRIVDSGMLIPTPEYVEIVLPHLANPALTGPLVLSSVGRMFGEEQGVIQATEQAGHPIKVVPFLDIPPEVAFERLAQANRGRADDTPDKLMVRFDAFQNSTLAVVDTYDRLGLMVPVEATGAEDAVFDATVHAIHEFAQQQ